MTRKDTETMHINETPEHHEEPKDKDTSQKPTNTSRAGIPMHPAARLTGSEG